MAIIDIGGKTVNRFFKLRNNSLKIEVKAKVKQDRQDSRKCAAPYRTHPESSSPAHWLTPLIC